MLHNICRSTLLLVILALALAAMAPAVMAHQPVDDDPDALRASILAHRQAEADRKGALAKKQAEAVALMTPNMAFYDVTHYDIDLDLNPSSNMLSGTVITTATVVDQAINTLDLDLWSNLTVSAATSGGGATTFSRSGHVVTVTLDRTYAVGEEVVVGITYSGNPAGEFFGWSSHLGEHMIWTLSEPFGARHWWPCKDANVDKADALDIHVTVPSNLIVASQGLLIDTVNNIDTVTYHWQTNYPTATYLVSLAIHPYVYQSDWYTPLAGGDPMEIAFYIYPDHVDDVAENYALTKDMIRQFALGYGEYPFVNEKYGHAEFNWGGGMEHQTISSMGGWSEDLISHELAHQWWGDMVTCADFGHIWLNEGFATWSEAYWKETIEGVEVYRQYMDIASYYGGGTIFVEDVENDNIFDSNLSYNKGSWIVHMLRGVLGDVDFFAGLAEYRAQYEYGSATTEQLRDVLEQVSGRDLDAFFEQWIYGEYYPIYSYGWTEGPGANQITLTIDQVQTNTGLFTMPIEVHVHSAAGGQGFTVENSEASQSYVLDVNDVVSSVEIDPNKWILRRVQASVTNPTFEDGILLVNGVHWGTYDTEITSAFNDSIYTGGQEFAFWDCFPTPGGGYPASLPEPLGHGGVPADLLGQYSTVVWVGNNYAGDLNSWYETPIQSYLEVGGNVLLMTRRSYSYLEGSLTDYLGITWSSDSGTLGNCLAVVSELVNIPFTGQQSWNDVYRTAVGPNTTLLFQDTAGFSGPRGIGARVVPPEGGTHREDGGQMVHIAGRPYRLDHDAVLANTTVILDDYFGEPYNGGTTAVPEDTPTVAPAVTVLEPNYPNPFNPQTVMPFRLAVGGHVSLSLFDARGRLVVRLKDESMAAGRHEVRWNGRDGAGRSVSSGTYFVRLVTVDGGTQTRVMTLVR